MRSGSGRPRPRARPGASEGGCFAAGLARQVGLWDFCVSAVSPTPVLSLFWLRNVSSLLAIQWPPMSAGTLLADCPAQGWAGERAGLPISQSSTALPPPPILTVPPSPPTSGLLVPQRSCPSLWPLRSCHRGYAISGEAGDRRPHLQGLHPPGTPLFTQRH